MTVSDGRWRWPASQPVWCSGCGAEFGRDRSLLVHPEPWCDAMMRGEERPTTKRPSWKPRPDDPEHGLLSNDYTIG